MGDYAPFLIQQILQNGGTDRDFERFCVHHYSRIEGFQYYATSRNYDSGIDGQLNKWRPNGGSYIIASLQKSNGLLAKACRDLKTLLNAVAPRPAKVRVCFAQLNSNSSRLEILKALRKINSRVEYDVSGITELVEEVDQHSAAFSDIYSYQLDEVRRQMERHLDRSAPQARRLGLRILLSVQLDGNAIDLRNKILRGLVLQLTPQNETISEQDLLRAISDAIGLDRAVQSSYLADTLNGLQADGFLDVISGNSYRRRRAADDALKAASESAASEVLDGYTAFKNAIHKRLSRPLGERTFNLVWQTVKHELIELFRAYGIEVVNFVTRLNGEPAAQPVFPTTMREGFQHIAQNLSAAHLSLDEQQIATLIKSIPEALLDETTGARRWVARLCLGYVCACSLGLHPDALKRLEVQLRSWHVIPDTHVLLSALGEGERDHQAIRQLLAWWIESGGKFYSVDPIMCETLRHAEIGLSMVKRWAKRYRACRGHWRPQMPDQNVFLRSIAKRHSDPTPSQAESYLGQFLGGFPEKHSKLAKIVEDEFHFIRAIKLQVDADFQEVLYRENLKVRLKHSYDNKEEQNNAIARCRNDSETLAYLSTYRKMLGNSQTAILLSQSPTLQRICESHPDRFSYTSVTVDPTRLLFVLSLNPGAGFSLATIESALFGMAFQKQVALNEQHAQKVADELILHEPVSSYSSTLENDVQRRLISRPRRDRRVGRGVMRVPIDDGKRLDGHQ
jgi:DNA-binding transcriptional ArsR family regulator